MIDIEIKKELLGINRKFILDASFKIEKNEFIALFGKSGSGKTTTLRCIAGLEKPEEGLISVNGKKWFSSKERINLSSQKRKIGMVFQSYALFPNKTVYENIIFGCRDIDSTYIEQLIATVELQDLKKRFPATLSGGQQQRVALARAIATKPDVLLLDEPLSALDASIRGKLQDEIKSIHHKFNLTTVMVTHDIQEVVKLADRVINLDEGKIIKTGTPRSILFGKEISAKFSFVGQIIDIINADVVHLAIISIANTLVQVVVTDNDLKEIKIGDSVYVGTKGLNPIIKLARK